ncbi:MAG: Spermidine/putrescine transport system permease protein PotB [candidate division BRC1 bacterium ADurb.BinA292]|nr:MAG: Spermidine/putrescine transport system permease protein PotB [candidate division BRC1 bacterium ADurb.BinA292]
MARLNSRTDPVAHGLALLLLILLLGLLIWPIVSVVRAGFVDREGPTLFYFASIFDFSRGIAGNYYLEGLWNALRLATVTTLLCLAVALPLAWLMANHVFAGQKMLATLLLVPLILPPFVGALGLRRLLAPTNGPLVLLLRRFGLLGDTETLDLLAASPFLATAILMTLHLFPIVFLNLQAALANIDPALEEAAQNLGARPLHVFRRVTLPLIMPGLFAGATICFIWSFTELGTPLMVGFRDVAAVQVFDGLTQIEQKPKDDAQNKKVIGATAGKATVSRQARRLGPLATLAALAAVGLLICLAALPHLGVLSIAFAERWPATILPAEWTFEFMGQVLRHPLTGPSIANSLKYSALATLLNLTLGVAIGWIVVRTTVRWRGALDGLAMLPLAVPGLVMAFGYLSITRRGMPLAFLNPDLGDPTALLVIAYAVRRLPYVVRSVVAGLQQTSETLEEAAWNLGASRLHTIRRITLPLIMANLIAGAILAFSFAMLEVSDSLILAFRQQHFPITKAIYQLAGRLGDGPSMACALGVLGMLLLTITLFGASRLLGRKLGALFRF